MHSRSCTERSSHPRHVITMPRLCHWLGTEGVVVRPLQRTRERKDMEPIWRSQGIVRPGGGKGRHSHVCGSSSHDLGTVCMGKPKKVTRKKNCTGIPSAHLICFEEVK